MKSFNDIKLDLNIVEALDSALRPAYFKEVDVMVNRGHNLRELLFTDITKKN